MARVDGEVRVCTSFTGEAAAKRKELEDTEADVRLLGRFENSLGVPSLEFGKSVDMLKESPLPGWTFRGPRLVRELLVNIRDGPGNLVSYHAEWVRLSGIYEGSSFV